MKEHGKYIVISLLIGGFLGSALTLFALQLRPGGMHGRGFGPMRQKLYHELQLTPEQKAKVDTIMQTSRKKMEALRNAAREEIRKELVPEQQAKFDQLNTKMDTRRQKWMNRGSGK